MLFKTRHANKQLPPSFFGQKDHIINKPTCQKKQSLYNFNDQNIKRRRKRQKMSMCVRRYTTLGKSIWVIITRGCGNHE